MKNFYALILFLIGSYVSYAQSIQNVYPSEARRNDNVWLTIQGMNTHFMESSSLTILLKSNVDGSIITFDDVYANTDDYCEVSTKIPATATPGKYAVSVVTTNEGTLSKTNAFTITNDPPVPELISITPSYATNGEHVRVNIKARYAKFLMASNLQVYINGNTTHLAADSVVAMNDTTLSAVLNIPVKNRSDICDVTVYTNTESIYLWQAFTISGIDPEIVSITPDSASDGEQVDVTIHTSKTSFMSSSSLDVKLQGGWAYFNATSVTRVSDTVLIASFDIPEKTRTSFCDVIILDDGDAIRYMGWFTINGIEPEVTDVTPAEGEQGQTLDVTITGQDMFFIGASGIDVRFYGETGGFIQANSVTVLNDNQVRATIKLTASTPIGSYDVNVIVDGNGASLYQAFTVVDDGIPDPELVSITPDEAIRGQVLDVTITGQRTQFTQASNIQVFLSGGGFFESQSTVVLSDTKLKCTFDLPSNAPPGLYSVFVSDVNDMNALVLYGGFTIVTDPSTDPHLVTISPAMTFPGHTLDVTITGANTHFMATSTTTDIYIFSQTTYITASSFTATSNTTITARFEIPEDFPLGVYDFGIMSAIDNWMELLQSVIVNAVGLDETEKLIGKLYPNPASDKLYIETKSQVRNFTIIDISGKQIQVSPNDVEQNGNQFTVPIDKLGLRKGIYFIRLESDSGFDYQKFIVE